MTQLYFAPIGEPQEEPANTLEQEEPSAEHPGQLSLLEPEESVEYTPEPDGKVKITLHMRDDFWADVDRLQKRLGLPDRDAVLHKICDFIEAYRIERKGAP